MKLKRKQHATIHAYIHKKLFPRSCISTLDPSTTVILPMPPRTRFFKASEPVGPQLSKHMLAFSNAVCPCSPQILSFSKKIGERNKQQNVKTHKKQLTKCKNSNKAD